MTLKKNKNFDIAGLLKTALAEDIGPGDITAQALGLKQQIVSARLFCKHSSCVLCGLDVFKQVFFLLDPRIKIKSRFRDGMVLKKNDIVCEMRGPVSGILKGERTALNFLARMSGIATMADFFSSRVKGTKTVILDTRKTTPGLRVLEKYAVKVGGASNHRFGLFDQVLIKDNHIFAGLNTLKLRDLAEIVNQARTNVKKNTIVEIEVETLTELSNVLGSGPDIVMLDNMNVAMMKKAVALRDRIAPGVKLEASGNISADNIRRVAMTGVDFISLGSLTHSVKNIDFSLKIV